VDVSDRVFASVDVSDRVFACGVSQFGGHQGAQALVEFPRARSGGALVIEEMGQVEQSIHVG